MDNIQAEAEKRKEEFLALQKAHKEQDLKKVNRYLSAAHMAISISIAMFTEAEDLLDENDIVLDNALISKQKNFTEVADEYCREFATMIVTDLEKRNYWRNLEEITTKYKQWAGIDNSKSPWKKVKDSLPEVGEKVLVITRNGKYAISEMYIPKDCYGKVLGDKVWKGSGAFVDSIEAWRCLPNYDLL